MSVSDVVVIDYGMGNLLSVQRGLEHCGARVTVTADHDVLLGAPRVVLPGVGAFGDGMAELKRQGLDVVIKGVAKRGTPLLGICLGMQMLLDESEEFGLAAGLGLIRGRVIGVPAISASGALQKIPHIGWSALVMPLGREDWKDTPLKEVGCGEAVYFVHSFMADPTDSRHRIADCLYGGQPVAAAIGRDNLFGCQFHPEKSGKVGLRVLKAFLDL